MSEPTDHELLADYARTRAEAPFAQLVARHINLVHSAARRYAGSEHQAEEITQAVFLILARKAGNLSKNTVVSGWLYQTARFTAANALKADLRRQRREQEAYMESKFYQEDLSRHSEAVADAAVWREIAPLLDGAMGKLGETDRTVLVLRFFERQTNAQVAAALGLAEGAVQKRVLRALEKLRASFARQGVTHTAQAIAGTVTQNAVLAAPAGLLLKVSVIAAKGAATTATTSTLVNGALKVMGWSKAKTAIAVTAGMLLAAATTTLVMEKVIHVTVSADNPSWEDDPKYWTSDPRQVGKIPKAFVFRPTKFTNEEPFHVLWGQSSEPSRYLAKNMDVSNILAIAYHARLSRMVLPADIPPERFDVMLTRANGEKEMSQMLRDTLSLRFGLAAHYEIRDTDILGFRIVKSPASGLKLASGGKLYRKITAGEIVFRNAYWFEFCSELEDKLRAPIVDSSDLSKTGKHYDMDLLWRAQLNESQEQSIKQALSSQLGLELVHTNMPLKVLVVERVN